MLAFGRSGALKAAAFGSFPHPTIGSLHARYSGLPSNGTCELLVDVAASSVNPSDVEPTIALGDFPKVLGSDLAGVVRATGDGCMRLAVGDRVWGDIGANTHASGGGKTKELGAYAPVAVALESQVRPAALPAHGASAPQRCVSHFARELNGAGSPTRVPRVGAARQGA
eukprot:301171-Prymnesium_polylepis.2